MKDLFLGMTKLYRGREQFRTLALDVAHAAADCHQWLNPRILCFSVS